jgi:hypothetical protein
VSSLLERLCWRTSIKRCQVDHAHSELRNWVKIFKFDTWNTFWWDENQIRILVRAGEDPVYPNSWVCDRETWRMNSADVLYCLNTVKMRRAIRNWYLNPVSKYMFSFELKMTLKAGFSPQKSTFPIKRGVSYTLLYPWRCNISWKTSLVCSSRCFTHVSAWFDHMTPCSEKWLQNSNFSARRTIQFQRPNWLSVMFNCFHIAGLLRTIFSKRWLALHGSTHQFED